MFARLRVCYPGLPAQAHKSERSEQNEHRECPQNVEAPYPYLEFSQESAAARVEDAGGAADVVVEEIRFGFRKFRNKYQTH